MPSRFAVKISFKDDIRRFTLSESEMKFSTMKKIIAELFSFSKEEFFVKYFDEDRDLITIESDNDLKEAIDVFAALRIKTARYYLHLKADQYDIAQSMISSNVFEQSTYQPYTPPGVQMGYAPNMNVQPSAPPSSAQMGYSQGPPPSSSVQMGYSPNVNVQPSAPPSSVQMGYSQGPPPSSSVQMGYAPNVNVQPSAPLEFPSAPNSYPKEPSYPPMQERVPCFDENNHQNEPPQTNPISLKKEAQHPEKKKEAQHPEKKKDFVKPVPIQQQEFVPRPKDKLIQQNKRQFIPSPAHSPTTVRRVVTPLTGKEVKKPTIKMKSPTEVEIFWEVENTGDREWPNDCCLQDEDEEGITSLDRVAPFVVKKVKTSIRIPENDYRERTWNFSIVDPEGTLILNLSPATIKIPEPKKEEEAVDAKYEHNLNYMTELGFSRDTCLAILKANNNDLESSINTVLMSE